jgi:hypothetical protein
MKTLTQSSLALLLLFPPLSNLQAQNLNFTFSGLNYRLDVDDYGTTTVTLIGLADETMTNLIIPATVTHNGASYAEGSLCDAYSREWKSMVKSVGL